MLGLLVVLLPFGSSNLNNANAIASEDEYYNEQYDERYANDNDYFGPEQERSYSYDDDYKSKDRDRSISVSITEKNCINVNNNINGDVIGNISVGNSQQTSEDRPDEVGVNTYGNNGERNYEGSKDKGTSCVTNNNNTNTNIITNAGNGTNGNATLSCVECFEDFLTPQEIELFESAQLRTIETQCFLIESGQVDEIATRNTLLGLNISEFTVDALIDCLIKGGFLPNDTSGLGMSNLPTGSGLLNIPTAPSMALP